MAVRTHSLVAAAAAVAIVALAQPASAQGGGGGGGGGQQQPPQNLQYFPKDTRRADLLPIMRGFTISLGVRCEYCHAMREGAPEPPPGGVYIVAMEGTRLVAPMLARALRQVYTVDYDLEARGMNAQMKAADKSGARAVMLLGDEEWERGEVVLKELKTGAQQTVRLEGIVAALDQMLLGEAEGAEAE